MSQKETFFIEGHPNITNLTQTDADALIAMPKVRVDQDVRIVNLPQSMVVPLLSEDGRENFFLDIHSGRLRLTKVTYQTRGKQVVVLVRLDVDGPPHRNPDGEEHPCPHLHLFREGFGDKWAIPVPQDKFTNLESHWQTLQDFMDYCSIVEPPVFERGMFA
ncbi:MAG: hypothetical protein WCK15_02470 [Pirellula sp.]